MRKAAFLLALVLGAAAAVSPAVTAAPAKKNTGATNPVDWSRQVAMTPEGGFRMGNPNARVKVVEYGSLTCPHCADFAGAAKGPLAARVRTGKVSFEFRNMVLNGIDVTATLVARCGGPRTFFPLTERLYATQQSWVGKISGLPQAEKDKLKALSEGQRLARLADIGGITQIAAQGGVTPARARACLADPAALDRLGKMYEEASALGVEGTPTFFINGARVHAHDWPSLESLIASSGG